MEATNKKKQELNEEGWRVIDTFFGKCREAGEVNRKKLDNLKGGAGVKL